MRTLTLIAILGFLTLSSSSIFASPRSGRTLTIESISLTDLSQGIEKALLSKENSGKRQKDSFVFDSKTSEWLQMIQMNKNSVFVKLYF